MLSPTYPQSQTLCHHIRKKSNDVEHLPGVTVHGFLSKSKPAEFNTLTSLFAESSLFFMPSKQEAFGIAYCEACAYGLPSVALATGGVSTIINNNVNGLLLDIDVTSEECADGIVGLWADRPRWLAMREAARNAYVTRLNWEKWGDAVEQELYRITSRSPR